MDSHYFVKKACLERDRQEVLDVWGRNGVNTTDPSRHFTWAYEKNPYGQSPIYLLVHTPTHHIIGSAGLILRRMKIGDTSQHVGRAAGFAVDKAHRSLGPAILLEKALLSDMDKSHISLVYTLATPLATPVYRRLKYGSLGKMDCRRKMIRSSTIVENRFSALPRFARMSLSWLLDLGIQILSKETWSSRDRAKILRFYDFDDRFDELWCRAAPKYSFTTERSSAFLRWRFINNPQHRDFVCDALCTDNGSLRGYAIYYLDEARTAHILDLFAEDQEGTTLELLAGLACRWRSDGVMSAVFNGFGSARFFDTLDKIGLSKLGAPNPGPYELFVSTGLDHAAQTAFLELPWGFTMTDDFLDYL